MTGSYYSGYEDDRRRKPRRNIFVWLLDLTATLLTVGVGLAMAMTYFVPYVNPSRIWFFPILGLAAPGIYVATVILALYWIIRWRPLRAIVMTLLVVVGFFKVSLFYKPEFRRHYGEENFDRRAIKVMSYNVRFFYGDDKNSSVEDVVRFIEEHDPDIVCIQEFNPRLAAISERYAQFGEKYSNATFGFSRNPDSLNTVPMRIMAKYPILRSGIALTPASSVWADVLIGSDTVRVFSNHLRSTAIKEDDTEYITNREFLTDTAREDKLRSIVGRFRENSVLRAAQVDSIADLVAAWRSHCILCGDFNDTPMSYVYRVMAQGLNDAFREKGAGYSHTFRGFFNMLRIDYMLSSQDFEVLSYEVPQVDYSDHHPIVVRLKKTVKN